MLLYQLLSLTTRKGALPGVTVTRNEAGSSTGVGIDEQEE